MAEMALVIICAVCLVIALPGAVQSKEPQTVIIVSMDGMPWDLISSQFANTPNLDRVAKNGVKAKYIKTVVPGKTWRTHQSLLTGLYLKEPRNRFQRVLGSSL